MFPCQFFFCLRGWQYRIPRDIAIDFFSILIKNVLVKPVIKSYITEFSNFINKELSRLECHVDILKEGVCVTVLLLRQYRRQEILKASGCLVLNSSRFRKTAKVRQTTRAYDDFMGKPIVVKATGRYFKKICGSGHLPKPFG